MLLVGMFQGVEEAVVDGTRLVNDDIEKHLGSLDGLLSQALNAL